MFDAHTHLNSEQLFPHRKNHVVNFIKAGGTSLITIGIDAIYNEKNITICKEWSTHDESKKCSVSCTIGIHPCSVGEEEYASKSHIDKAIIALKEQYNAHQDLIVGIGECGIDAHRGDYDAIKSLQWYAFEQQCALAQQLQLPIVVHSRSQRPDTLAILKQRKDLNIYLHCRGYTPTEVEEATNVLANLWIGFCGNTTYPKASDLKESLQMGWELQHQGSCKVLVETDAPYLAPQTRRGTMNTPTYLKDSIVGFSNILGVAYNNIVTTTTKNAKELYYCK